MNNFKMTKSVKYRYILLSKETGKRQIKKCIVKYSNNLKLDKIYLSKAIINKVFKKKLKFSSRELISSPLQLTIK